MGLLPGLELVLERQQLEGRKGGRGGLPRLRLKRGSCRQTDSCARQAEQSSPALDVSVFYRC